MVYLFIIFGIFCRLIPHLPNVTPVAAIALFGGAYLGKRSALIVPLVIMIISDLFLGFHPVAVFVWGSFLLTVFIGLWLKEHRTVKNIIGASLSSSFIFFIVTNFGVWASPASWYPHTWQGLVNCYVMAIPFFRNTILGDIGYVALFFGVYELAQLAVKRITANRLTIH